MTFTKRLLASLLSVIMVVTTIPAFSFTASAAEPSTDKVLFAYFCGDDKTTTPINQKIRLAVSEDGITFSPLNANLPLFDNLTGATESDVKYFNGVGGKFAHTGGARDPFIINKRNSDGSIIAGQYYVVATDLCVNPSANSYNNTKMMVWDVNSLANASNIKPKIIDTAGMFSNQSTVKGSNDAIAWAPEVVWCQEQSAYAIFWAGPLYTNARINVAFTNDFQTFRTSTGATIDGSTTYAETLYEVSGGYCIDANINYENGKYYMIFKREDSGSKGQLYFASASTLMGLKNAAPVRFYESVNSGDPNGLEGPEIYKRPDGHWVLIADEYVKNPVCSFAMYDLGTSLQEGLVNKGGGYDHRKDKVSTNINSVNPRHGGIATISNDEYNSLISTYGGYTPDAPGELVAQYFTTNSVTEDATGHNYTLTDVNSNLTVTEIGGKKCVYFSNGSTASNSPSAKYAQVSTSSMHTAYNFNANKGVTFTWYAYDLGTTGGYDAYANLYNLSTYTGTAGSCSYDESKWPQNAYNISYVTSQLSSGISNGTQSAAGIQRVDGNSAATGAWHYYKAVYGLNGMQVYRDNSLVQTFAIDGINNTWFSNTFGNGVIKFGASLFANDKLFNGYISDFRIYNTSNAENIARIDNPPVVVNPGEEVKTFEDTLASGKIYKNMKPAYEAYVNYWKAYDAKFYGGNDSIDLKTYTDKLGTAINSMTEYVFTPQKANNEKGAWKNATDGSKVTFADSYTSAGLPTYYPYQNILYAGAANEDVAAHDMSSNKQVKAWLRYQPLTMMYDGITKPQAPIMVVCGTSGKKDRYLVYMGMTDNANNSLKITDMWLGSRDSSYGNNWDWINVYQRNGGTDMMIPFSTDYTNRANHRIGNSNWASGWTTTPGLATMFNFQGSFAAGEYIKTIRPTITCYISGSDNNNLSDINLVLTPSSTTYDIRVINYKAIIDAAANLKSNTTIADTFANVAQYRQGGLTDLFTKIEEAQNALDTFNVNSYFTSTTDVALNNSTATGNKYQDCADRIKEICDFVNGVGNTGKTVDNTNYQALRDAIDADLSGSPSNNELSSARVEFSDANTQFTKSSYNRFNTQFADAQAIMAAPLNDGYVRAGDAGTTATNLDKAYKSLMPLLDTAVLTETINDKTSLIQPGLFDQQNKQIYTIDSWNAISRGCANATQVLADATADATIGKYAVNANGTTDFTTLSTQQSSVDASEKTLSVLTLQACDTDEKYQVFDAAINVLLNADLNKFIPSVQAEIIDEINNSLSSAYGTDVTAYNKVDRGTFTSAPTVTKDTSSFSSENLLKNSSDVDSVTAAILNLINDYNNNADAIAKITSYLTLDGVVGDANTVNYGENFEFTIADVVEGDAVLWTVTKYDNIGKSGDSITGTKLATVNYTTNSNTLNLKADTDVSVTATVLKGASTGANKVTNLVNIYGNIYKSYSIADAPVLSADKQTLTVGGEVITAPTVAFYNFTGWSLTNSDNTYRAVANYAPVTETRSAITFDGNTTYAKFNQSVSITTDKDFYAWAVLKDGKYQIVSYVKDYTFSAVCDESYVVVSANGDGHYYADGVLLTAENVDGFNNPTKTNDQAFLDSLLANKMGFATVIKVVDVTDQMKVPNKKTIRVYGRVTVGSSVNEYGVVITKQSNTASNPVNTVNRGGQFSYTYNIKDIYNVSDYTNSAYSVVSFNYTAAGATATINTSLVSAGVNA